MSLVGFLVNFRVFFSRQQPIQFKFLFHFSELVGFGECSSHKAFRFYALVVNPFFFSSLMSLQAKQTKHLNWNDPMAL